MDNERYIGLVKWFHDNARDANYGFIQHVKLGELFFHERSIEQGQNLDSFCENAIVVFISQESKRQKDKLEAVHVKHLETEKDLIFLFSHFLSVLTEKNTYSDYTIIQKGVHLKINSLLDESTDKIIRLQLFELYQDFLNKYLKTVSTVDEEYIKVLLKICKNFFSDKYQLIANTIENNISSEFAHKLWLDGYIDNCQIGFIASNILYEPQLSKRTIFNKSKEDDKLNIFLSILNNITSIDTEQKIQTIREFLKLVNEFCLDQKDKILFPLINTVPDYFQINFWQEDLIFIHEILKKISDQKIFDQLVQYNELYVKTSIKAEYLENIAYLEGLLNLCRKYFPTTSI